ncbi:MAG: flagellar filament capping protein FliD [Porticoccus sp.]|nr:flagellar filament capping protein FliD [Porticoccus sp.]
MPTISTLGVGSGLDLNGLLDQLEDAERGKLAPIVAQKSEANNKISAYGQLKSALTQLQTAAENLSSADTFEAVEANYESTAFTVKTGINTPIGSYQVDVTQLARAYSIATTGIANEVANLGAGTMTFTLANGDVSTVEIDADDSSLESIRNAINAGEQGVTASIVNDGTGSPYRLVISSTETGSEGAITSIDFGDLAGSLTTDAGTEITAENATLTVNGIDIISQSNKVDDAIQDVTLNLKEVGSGSLSLDRDTAAITETIEKFVKAYNSLQESVSSLSSFDQDTGISGTLLGESTLRSVQTQLRSVLSEGVGNGALGSLSDVGISLQLDGSLEIDEDALEELVENQGGALSDFFAGLSLSEGGLADNLGDKLENILKANGLLENKISALEGSVERFDQRYGRVEETIEATVDRYRTQFGQLDALISSMNSTSNYLTQQFEMMSEI